MGDGLPDNDGHSLSASAIAWGGMRFHWRLLWTLAFNTLVAGFLTAIGYGGTLAVNMVFAQCIGLSIFAMIEFAVRDRRAVGTGQAARIALAVVAGSLAGVLLASVVTGVVDERTRGPATVMLQTVLIALLFGGIAGYYFLARQRLLRTRTLLQQQELQRLQAEHDRTASELRLLRAQVEPHMLFNSLAHVHSLIDSNPERGKRMLDHLIDYLRHALRHARETRSALADELRLLDNYLGICRIRIGERLDYRIEVPDALAAQPVPPMLLQPLVENAVRHGIEPAEAGGSITVSAHAQGDGLIASVRDTGVGFGPTCGGSGVGLANLRERLAALYGDCARLRIEENPGGGVVASLHIPLRAQ